MIENRLLTHSSAFRTFDITFYVNSGLYITLIKPESNTIKSNLDDYGPRNSSWGNFKLVYFKKQDFLKIMSQEYVYLLYNPRVYNNLYIIEAQCI